MASQDAVSGPQASVTVWERCRLESQVAELTSTKPSWRTERVHNGVCRTCLGSLQLGLQVTTLQGQRQLRLPNTRFATARTEPDAASSSKWLLTEPLLLGTVTSSLSYLPPWTPRPEPPTPVSCLLRLAPTREHWVPSVRRVGWGRHCSVSPQAGQAHMLLCL